MDKYIMLVVFMVGIVVGVIGGKYYGQSEVFQQLLDDKIECTLDVNPISTSKLK